MKADDLTATFLGMSIGMWQQSILVALVLGFITFLMNKLWHYLWNRFIKKK